MSRAINKNNYALFIGISLIIMLFLLTLLRSPYFKKSTEKTSDHTTQLENEVMDTLKNATKVSPADLARKMQSKETLNLIDIREESAFIKEHLSGATNIPLSNIKDSATVLEKNKNYLLIDVNSFLTTTAYAVKIFSELGFKNISYLEGGFATWKESYYPTISTGDPQSFSDQSKVNFINSDQLKAMLASEKNITLIDVRKNALYQEGHLKSATNIFLEDLESKKSTFPASGKIVLYDDNGLGAFQGAVRLFDMGIFNVSALSDGLIAWKNKQYEIVR